MKTSSSFLRLLLIVFPVFCLTCSSLSGIDLTGGSGAGNPGGTVSIALSILTDSIPIAKAAAAPGEGNGITIIDSSKPVVVKDQAGLSITVTGVQLNSANLSLILDERENPYHILDSLEERPPYLVGDSQSVVINKQYSFNCLNGEPDSAVPPVTMPVARYTGVMLHFNQNYSLLQADSASKSQILITGSLVYNGQTHAVRIDINRTFSPYYKFAGGIFTLSETDTTHLEIRFNASQWFHGVNFKQCLDQGLLIFSPDGEIVISSASSRFGMFEIESRIRTDFINSGKLNVY